MDKKTYKAPSSRVFGIRFEESFLVSVRAVLPEHTGWDDDDDGDDD